MKEKKYKLAEKELKTLISPSGSCFSSDKITVEGLPVAYMYRETPTFEEDSGWKFFSGTETQEYIDNPENLAIYDINTIANYDPSIIPFINLPIGSELERGPNGTFKLIK